MQRLKNIFNLYKKNNYFTKNTPLEYNSRLSKKYNANIYLKRDLATNKFNQKIWCSR